ncbi:MAG: GntR family transcriptional regulator [Deltaproteobacteria bacterium]|nr:GntR family transcriptional regulator [Deltaproteobacteria bacterium]
MVGNNFGPIDKNSPVPLYFQINDILLKKIKAEEFKTHQQIPTEEELTATFQVSRMTVRQAISKMVTEGILYRKRGHGTFVAEPKLERKVAKLTSATVDMEEAGLKPGAIILHKKIMTPNEEERNILGLRPKEHVLEILRLRLANDQPIAIGRAVIPLKKYPDLVQANLDGVVSLTQYMEQNCGCRIAYADQKIKAMNANAQQARLLKIKKGTSVVHLNRVIFDYDRDPIGIFESFYRGDRYVFTSTLYK